MTWDHVLWGTVAGLCTGLATLVGALPALFTRPSSDTQQNAMLGFAAGVMLSASYLSLIVPAANFARGAGADAFTAAGIVAIAVLAGAASLDALRRSRWLTAPQHSNVAHSPELTRRVWLLVIAMTAHNLPEGAAVGVGFGAGDFRIGFSTAIGIGVQNLPEGLAVAAALTSIGMRRSTAVLIGGATGLVEPVGAFLGAAVVSLVSDLLPAGMGWAAGAMIYIVAAELIPAIHGPGSDDRRGSGSAIWAFLVGLAAMLFLDIALS